MNKSPTVRKKLNFLFSIEKDVEDNMKLMKKKNKENNQNDKSNQKKSDKSNQNKQNKYKLNIKIPKNDDNEIFNEIFNIKSPKICHNIREYYY